MNKDAESRWKVGMSNIKLKMRDKMFSARYSSGSSRSAPCSLSPSRRGVLLLEGIGDVFGVPTVTELAAANTNELFVYLAYFPTFMFWALDAYFLRQERLFRKLYDHVRTTEDGPVDFSMNTQPFAENADGTWSVAWSHTLRLFHGTITGTVLVVMLLLVLT